MSRLAVTIWKQRISPIFDTTEKLLVVDIERDKPWREMQVQLDRYSALANIYRIFELEVNTLFCGAISGMYANMIQAQGIELISFLGGNARKVLQTYLHSAQGLSSFQMPGCKGQKRKRYRGGKR